MLTGGLGNDVLTGGAGADTFVFANNGSLDSISDFQTGVDHIDLRGIAGVSAQSVSYNMTTRQVQIDTNGDSVADMFINVNNPVGVGDYFFAP